MNKKLLEKLLKRNKSHLQELRKKLKGELRQEELEEVEKEIEELQEEIQELTETIEALEQDVEELDGEIEEIDKSIDEIEEQIDELEENVTDEVIDGIEEQIDEIIEGIEEKIDDKNIDEEERKKLKKRLSRAKRKKRVLRAKKINKIKTQKRSEDEELLEKVEDLTEEVQELIEALEDVTEEIEDVTDDVETDENNEERGKGNEQRKRAMVQIGRNLSTRQGAQSKRKEAEIRKAFANFVVGNIGEAEARSLGIEVGNGGVTVPTVIVKEIITYAQEENLLRKYGSTHPTKGNVQYPVLVKKPVANVNTTERDSDMPVTDIELSEVLLNPAEFDALATVSRKLVKMSGVDIEEVVIEELKKAYVEKETVFMFDGRPDAQGKNENPGSLLNRAVRYYETEKVDLDAAGLSQKLYQQLVKFKGQAPTPVLKKAMWIVNRAAFTALEGLIDGNGRPLLYEAPDGMGYRLLGHNLDFTDAANVDDASIPVFYFGDFKSFHIQDVIGSMELHKLTEQFARQNKIGFQIYNLLDGQLVYSPLEPTVFRYEVGLEKPNP